MPARARSGGAELSPRRAGAGEHKLPAICGYDFLLREGGLMSYGPGIAEMSDRAAVLAVRILTFRAYLNDIDSGQPRLEEPSPFVPAINLKTAKKVGLPIPPSLSARTDLMVRYQQSCVPIHETLG
jgi:putative tryptophan/tyrosine transport system substrate-binding protein